MQYAICLNILNPYNVIYSLIDTVLSQRKIYLIPIKNGLTYFFIKTKHSVVLTWPATQHTVDSESYII